MVGSGNTSFCFMKHQRIRHKMIAMFFILCNLYGILYICISAIYKIIFLLLHSRRINAWVSFQEIIWQNLTIQHFFKKNFWHIFKGKNPKFFFSTSLFLLLALISFFFPPLSLHSAFRSS